jgi:hypothetical protein
MSTVGRASSAAAISEITAGGIRGSSPCKLTTISPKGMPRACATSAMRSVPDACRGDVRTQSAPNFSAACKIRSSSVATMTDAAPLLHALSHTHWMSGRFAMGSSGFPGRRVAAKRAGMTT